MELQVLAVSIAPYDMNQWAYFGNWLYEHFNHDV